MPAYSGWLTRISSFLHPILSAAFPLLSLFEQNESEVELSVLWRFRDETRSCGLADPRISA